MEEVWKPIKDYELYEISNKGNVRSYCNNRHGISNTPKQLKPCITRNGYGIIQVQTKPRVRFYIHRLVGIHFIPNPTQLPFIDHIDRNPLNNNQSNLRWVDHSANMSNTGVSKNNKLGELNISIEKNKYVVQIMRRGEKKTGRFETLEKAIEFRDCNK